MIDVAQPANADLVDTDNKSMTAFRTAGVLAAALAAPWVWAATAHAEDSAQLDRVPVVASPTCGGSVSAEAQVTPVQVGDRVEDGVRVAIHYDAGVYDGSCSLTVAANWVNLDTGASGRGDITAVSTIDGHYGFIGYANTTFETGSGTVVVTLSSHPGAELRITT
ncbi:hypothetical protein hbim_02062 [Mycolicibacterium mageritense]|uniref:Uncharacterized protein n=2 Tax=Mycolicibacterium mageritense TaxID=53462 RepID=A0AAI8TT86_MYCME|nr:hypothetical protein hbim_02062 [Mycolicibacterium mageritense]